MTNNILKANVELHLPFATITVIPLAHSTKICYEENYCNLPKNDPEDIIN